MTQPHSADDDAVAGRLDRLIGLMNLAFAEQIDAASALPRTDDEVKAILEASEDWVASGDLQSRVASSAKVSTRTVRNKLAELRVMGAITVKGHGPATEYRSTGVVR